jgi:transposase-like protein
LAIAARSAEDQKWFGFLNTSPEIIRLAVMMLSVRFPLSLRNVEDLLYERGIDISHEPVRLRWHRFGPIFAVVSRRWWKFEGRAENSHLPLRRRERAMLRFRRMRSLQKFASVHASVTNHFNADRSLSSRPLFKLNRAAALAEWRGTVRVSQR